MLQFLLSGLVTTLVYLLPLLLLPLAAVPLYRRRMRGRWAPLSPEDRQSTRLNFQIARYLVYLLATPPIMLITSVIIGFVNGTQAILESLIWLIVAITIAFSWCSYRLVGFVSTRSRLEMERLDGNAEEA